MTRIRWVALGVVLVSCLALLGGVAWARLRERRTLVLAGVNRTYILHVPGNLPRAKPVPLVLVFHGGGGTGTMMVRHTKFDPIADREGFIVAYPDGLGRSWNDGREDLRANGSEKDVDDVAFVASLIDAIDQEHPIDPKRIYATGMSNGACFCHYLASRLSKRIAAIAPVVGSIGTRYESQFEPRHAVSVLMINGTDDPLIRYQGGPVMGGRRGSVIPVERTLRLWLNADGLGGDPAAGTLPDADPADGCHVLWKRWTKPGNNPEVAFYKVVGGGHTWPGATQYLPKAVVGNLCRDFDASEAIWNFFKAHPKAD